MSDGRQLFIKAQAKTIKMNKSVQRGIKNRKKQNKELNPECP